MLNRHLRTTYIAVITLIVLMLSSVATSAPLMALKMVNMTNSAMVSNSDHCAEMMNHDTDTTNSKQCHQDTADVDTCCSMACISFFAYLPSYDTYFSRLSQHLKIPQDTLVSKVTYPRSLYRPPIA